MVVACWQGSSFLITLVGSLPWNKGISLVLWLNDRVKGKSIFSKKKKIHRFYLFCCVGGMVVVVAKGGKRDFWLVWDTEQKEIKWNKVSPHKNTLIFMQTCTLTGRQSKCLPDLTVILFQVTWDLFYKCFYCILSLPCGNKTERLS